MVTANKRIRVFVDASGSRINEKLIAGDDKKKVAKILGVSLNALNKNYLAVSMSHRLGQHGLENPISNALWDEAIRNPYCEYVAPLGSTNFQKAD